MHAGREYECDYGSVGVDGICVPYTMTPSGPDCGDGGQVVCAGDDLAGAQLLYTATPHTLHHA